MDYDEILIFLWEILENISLCTAANLNAVISGHIVYYEVNSINYIFLRLFLLFIYGLILVYRGGPYR